MSEFMRNHERDSTPSLGDILRRDGERLNQFATPGVPLTRERIAEVDPGLLESVDNATGVLAWPDEDSAVLPPSNSKLLELITDDPDAAFGARLVTSASGYNNFSRILLTKPMLLEEGEGLVEFVKRVPGYQYATKPYLHRAYVLAPDFMNALQRAVEERGGMAGWNRALEQAMAYPDKFHKEEMNLLKGSRIAYVMMADLMRKDDLTRQYAWLGAAETDQPVQDPAEEFWT